MAGKLEVVEVAEIFVALITCPDEASANALSDRLVGEQLAACVNVIPGLTSVYRWQGKVCRDTECLLVVKTTADHRQGVADAITAVHPYDEPELVFLPVHSGSRSYLHWLVQQTSI